MCQDKWRHFQSFLQVALRLFHPTHLQKSGEGGERLNYHKKAAAFIETCYWRAKITLNNNNPPPWKPIKCRQQTLGLPTALLEAAEVGLNDTW